ncbi:DNA gyrase inhibitor YacG [Azomonas macrocytogenes]|uniref:DNA gyrase inhibitor YacG n=1 Tax=Azomonas macrocytogenes TaxID=69962 RepID=A0A839T8V6_AZOMA|nr:DNA gyrase inhibitor YacG [Azomonas macrocytogenes]MBB3104664.1 hypothetical protein [Azomonas macrocytogenes]
MTSTIIRCPTCGSPVEWGPQSTHRPFCSHRCKLIDLGAWAAEEHAIPGDLLADELFSEDLPPRKH